MKFNPKKVSNNIQSFISKSLKQENITTVLIAVSGGIDSAVCLYLTVLALGPKNVYPVLLPYSKLNEEGKVDGVKLIKSLKIPKNNINIINIKPMVDKISSFDKSIELTRKGNIMARVRMLILFDLAKKYECLVIGTENKTEHLLGYYTRFGDEASDIEPLRDLYKNQIYQLARYLNIPSNIINKAPSAGLWLKQTDESEFGFSYKIADEILHLKYDLNFSKEEIIKKGYDLNIINRVLFWIEKGEFKKRVPIVYKRK